MKSRLLHLFFPPKCVMCKKVLPRGGTDICASCRETLPVFHTHKIKLSFLAQWTGVWYYKENVRLSILRYKFYGRRHYASVYGRFLAEKLIEEGFHDTDLLTWIPISARRKRSRGYDQTQLLAEAVAGELGTQAVSVLTKIRHNKPQSTMGGVSQRKANVLGAYRVMDPECVKGKRILLLDDIVTTGATASECARVLLTAGAKEVKLAALAVASHETQRK